jgi:hypothetical protein
MLQSAQSDSLVIKCSFVIYTSYRALNEVLERTWKETPKDRCKVGLHVSRD